MIRRLRLIRQRRELRRLERARATLVRSIVVNIDLDTGDYRASLAKAGRDLRRVEDRIRERTSIARYERRIRREREAGLSYVRAYADRVRTDLGLVD